MSILDLQGMGLKEESNSTHNSHTSQGCGVVNTGSTHESTLSVIC